MDQYVVYTAYVTDYAPASRTIPANVAAYLATISNSAKKRFSSAVGKNMTLDDTLSVTLPDGDGWCRREAPNYIVVDVYDGTGDVTQHPRVRRRAYFATIVPALSSVGYTAFDLVADPWATVTGIDITSANVSPSIKGWVKKTTDIPSDVFASMRLPSEMNLRPYDAEKTIPEITTAGVSTRLYGHCVLFYRRKTEAGNIEKRVFAYPICGADSTNPYYTNLEYDNGRALKNVLYLLQKRTVAYHLNASDTNTKDFEISGAYLIPIEVTGNWITPANAAGYLYEEFTPNIHYPATELYVGENGVGYPFIRQFAVDARSGCAVSVGNNANRLMLGVISSDTYITAKLSIDVEAETVIVTISHGSDTVDLSSSLNFGVVYAGITEQITRDKTSDAVRYASSAISTAVSVALAVGSGNPIPAMGITGTILSLGSNAANKATRSYSTTAVESNAIDNVIGVLIPHIGYEIIEPLYMWGLAVVQYTAYDDIPSTAVSPSVLTVGKIEEKYGYDTNIYLTLDISGNIASGISPQWYQIDDPEIDRTVRPAEYYANDEIIAPVAPSNADFDAVLEKFANGVRLIYAYS